MRVVFLGPPGAGKGTQAKILAEKKSLAHISTGDMLRAAVQEGSKLGLEVKGIMESGKLVPDGLIVDIIEQRVKKPDCAKGYIFDGFPRTIPQAEALDTMLKKSGSGLDAVVSFEVSEQDVLSRLAHRRGAEARADDDAKVQIERLRVYREQTEPLISYYKGTGLLRSVDATGTVEDVYSALLSALKV